MTTLTSYPLSQEQDVLLRTMATPFVTSGVWPVFGYVVAKMDDYRMDAHEALRSLPRVPDSVSILGRASYGFMTLPPDAVQEDTRLGLTIAAGLVLPEMRHLFGDPFLSVLHQMIKLYREAPAAPDKGKEVWLTSEELQASMGLPRDAFWTALPAMLGSEIATRRGSSSLAPDGSWKREIIRDVIAYEDVRSVEDYVAKVCSIVTGWAKEQDQLTGRVPPVRYRAHASLPGQGTPALFEQLPLSAAVSPGGSRGYVLADRAKAARVLQALPADARWLKVLAKGDPLRRIPLWLSDAVHDAHARLMDDVVDFIDPELATAHQAFVDALAALNNEFNGTFSPRGENTDYTEVPPEWKGSQPDQYYTALKDLSAARQGVLRSHKELMNTMNRKGHLPSQEEPSPQSFQLHSRDNSPITVYANQAHASHGGAASANVNPPSTAPDLHPTPWWNRSVVLWTALGAVAAVAGTVAGFIALYK
jgi:hypothetical protein